MEQSRRLSEEEVKEPQVRRSPLWLDKWLCEQAGGEWLDGRCHGASCMTCGRNGGLFGLERSHIIAKSQGGKDTKENVVLECMLCHRNRRHNLRLVLDEH